MHSSGYELKSSDNMKELVSMLNSAIPDRRGVR